MGKAYDAEEDYKQRVEEMRADWEAAMSRRAAEKELANDDVDEDDWSSEVSTFFARTKGANGNAAQSPFKQIASSNGDANAPGSSESDEENEKKGVVQ